MSSSRSRSVLQSLGLSVFLGIAVAWGFLAEHLEDVAPRLGSLSPPAIVNR